MTATATGVRIRGLTGTAMVSVYRMSRSAMERVEMASGIVMLMIPAFFLVILVMGPVVLGIYDVLIAGIVIVADSTGNVVMMEDV